jgi:catechol 2,3-dioxygenase-like lactoylglutathione lyase family enzyme
MKHALLAVLLCAASIGADVQEALPPPGFHHVHLNVVDPDAEVAFYTKHFTSASRSEAFGLPAIKSGRVLLLFTKVRRAPSDQPQSAYWHFGWHVPQAREYWRRYTSTGAPLMPLYADDGASVTYSNEWWPGILTKAGIAAAAARGTKADLGGYGYLRGPAGERVEFQGDLPAERFNHMHMFQDDAFCAELWYKRHLNAPVSPASRRGMRDGEATWKPLDVAEADCRGPRGEPSWLSLVPEGTVRNPSAGVIFDDVEMNWYQRQGDRPLASSRGQVIDHVGLSVRDLDAWHAKLRSERVRIVARPYRLGATRALMVEGPSRERIELVEIR